MPTYPSGSVPLESPYYLERPPIEGQVYEELQKPGALVRIKGPREIGKTSLLLRTLHHCEQLEYYTVSLNLEQVDDAILNDLNRFLRWLCANVTRQLQLEPKLNDYWDEDIGSKISCSLYFRNYLLTKIDRPLILAIDEVNCLFEHPQVAKDVLPLFRSWYEEAKRLPVWQKLRLVVAHSTEIYVPLQLTQSPFNVGLPVELASFSLAQVQQLAERYGLSWAAPSAPQQLLDLVGGHPALVHLAIYHLSTSDIHFDQFLATAHTSQGIYAYHLQRHQAVLAEQPELAAALETVLQAQQPVSIDPILAYKLSSLGLIKLAGEKVVQGCQLYQRYFAPLLMPAAVAKGQAARRRRGIVLTPQGLEKWQHAKTETEWHENRGKRFTLEELSERSGLSVDTLMKVQGCEIGVDKQTLKYLFQGFNLTLENDDFVFPNG